MENARRDFMPEDSCLKGRSSKLLSSANSMMLSYVSSMNLRL